MSLVFVVDDVLEVDALGFVQVVEELLVEDESDAGDFLHLTLGLGVLTDKVGRDGDGQFASKLLPLEPVQRVPLAVGADQDVELVLADGVVRRRYFGLPAGLDVGRFDQTLKADGLVDLDAENEADLEEDALQLPDRNVVDGSGAKFTVELFGAKASKVMDVVRPKEKDIVAAEPVALLDHDDLGPEELSFDGSSKTARTLNIVLFFHVVSFLGKVEKSNCIRC